MISRQPEPPRPRSEANGQMGEPDTHVGDFQRAFAEAAVRWTNPIRPPDQSHMMMEPHATIAKWDGDRLLLWTSTQMVAWTVNDLAKTLKIDKSRIHVMSPYIGGGFGGKLFPGADALLASLGARATGGLSRWPCTAP